MGEEAIEEAEDTMSILSYSTDDCTVSSKLKFYKDIYQGRFKGFIWLGGGSLEFYYVSYYLCVYFTYRWQI